MMALVSNTLQASQFNHSNLDRLISWDLVSPLKYEVEGHPDLGIETVEVHKDRVAILRNAKDNTTWEVSILMPSSNSTEHYLIRLIHGQEVYTTSDCLRAWHTSSGKSFHIFSLFKTVQHEQTVSIEYTNEVYPGIDPEDVENFPNIQRKYTHGEVLKKTEKSISKTILIAICSVAFISLLLGLAYFNKHALTAGQKV